jgi:excinuclease ABC subunit A
MADVKRLFDILHRLVDEGHTTVVIEHHPEVFAEGGLLVPQGTPGLLSLRRYRTEGWQILIF